MTGGGGSSHVKPLYEVTPLEGMRNRLGAGVTVTVNDGQDIAGAVAVAKAADVVILMVGYKQGEGRDNFSALDGTQDDLVAAVADANPRTVVVIKTGSALLMPWVAKVSALVEAWYPGEEDGNVVAAILFGDYNPSGKLPITFPKSLADVPAHTPEQYPGVGPPKQTVARYSEGVLVGYRWYDAQNIEPLYPFGYGLSYTTFDYRNLNLSAKSLSAAAPGLTVDFDIANMGKRAGAEVAQVYVGFPSPPNVPQPPRQLKGFARVNVDPGQTAHARVTLDARAFSYWDATTHGWKVAPGDYRIFVGASSRDIRLKDDITVQ
jgi:beta-glucosidase